MDHLDGDLPELRRRDHQHRARANRPESLGFAKFDVHPSKAPGEIQPVEPGEAEVLLDVLDGFFQFFFVLPAEMERKRVELMSKLNIAWKNAT